MTEPRRIPVRVTVFLAVDAPPQDDRPEPDAAILPPGVTAERIAFLRNHPFNH
jgi:hypothetical protein